MNGIELGGAKGLWRVSGWIVYAGKARVATVQNIGPKGEAIARAIAEVPAMMEVMRVAVEELEYFVDFARRQREFEGDEQAGIDAVKAMRAVLARIDGEI